jgi:signal transduction histidine kinase
MAHILSGSRSPGGTGTTQIPSFLPEGAVSFAHDLRNILSSVRSYAQLLLSTADNGKMLEYLGIIEAESSRCCDLIGRMLRPTDPREAEHTSESDPGCVAKAVCELARGEALLSGVELVWEANGRLPPVAIPREDLERVLLNLVRNAVQATRQGGRVDVRARRCRLGGGTPGIEIKVADTGRGIPKYALEMIFRPFFTTHDPGEGLGLGLAIASFLVKHSNGSIDVESKEGAGTSFSVRLPAA